MPIRRAADPVSIQHIWDAIREATCQNQLADPKRIIKYLQTALQCSTAQAELYIEQAALDGLIVALQKNSRATKGDNVDSYRIPTQELPEFDGKDWYCFECHLAGNVTNCATCVRVFHPDCISSGRKKFDEFRKSSRLYDEQLHHSERKNSLNGDPNDNSINDFSTYQFPFSNSGSNTTNNRNKYEETLCSICNIARVLNPNDLSKADLNYLLKFVIHRIQSWLPSTITRTMGEEEKREWMTDKELAWRANYLFFEHRDMSVIEVNLNNESYIEIYEFLADVLTIQHNVAVFHGIDSQEYGAAELMVLDTVHDLAELRLCPDCYRHSNEKVHPKWFCLPCPKPHKLVWAKQKGYPYWPAKVMNETITHYDVRFFGGKYERSLLAKSFIKPIETPQSRLQIKPSSAFNKAVEELKFHQKLLKNPDDVHKLLGSSKLKTVNKHRRSTIKKTANSTTDVRSNSPYDNEINNSLDNISFPQQSHSGASDRRKRRSSFYDGSPPVRKRSSVNEDNSNEIQNALADSVIHISDGDDEDFPYRENYSLTNLSCNGTLEQVSSSTENYRSLENTDFRNQENGMQQLDQPYSDSVEKMRRELESLSDNKDIVKCAMEFMQNVENKLTNDHTDHLKRLFESHNSQISDTKKKQWCYNCEQEAIYHCCWNTAYCSQTCQQQHWQAEHKKVCRRKR